MKKLFYAGALVLGLAVLPGCGNGQKNEASGAAIQRQYYFYSSG